MAGNSLNTAGIKFSWNSVRMKLHILESNIEPMLHFHSKLTAIKFQPNIQ